MEIIAENPNITRAEIAQKLGISKDGVRYHIKKLTEVGKLLYIGTSRNGYWKINEE